MKSMIPANIPLNSLDDLVALLEELFERAQQSRTAQPMYIGDCYYKVIDGQRAYMLEKVEGLVVLRKGVQKKLDALGMEWSFVARMSSIKKGDKVIMAFIAPF